MSKGAAILAVGHGLADATSTLTSLVAQIGETLLANDGWKVRRLSPLAGERDGADRASWKRCVSELCDDKVDTIVLAIAGSIIVHDDEPCLVTGPDAANYPEEHALPLSWITDRLRDCVADRVVVVASLDGPQDNADWLDALATNRARHVIATERSEGRAAALHALLAGARGAAVDPQTGTITLRSLGDFLAKTVKHARLQVSNESATLASSPPLVGPWDARLTSRPGVPRSTEQEAVLGTVLPGRFKIERELARGSFGNVYLARQLAVDRDVAVKVLHGGVAPGSETGRLFVQEIQSVGRLDHPNVVRIYQADITAAGSLFYAMELLSGRDLQQVIEKDGVLDKTRAVALARQLALALGAAHDVGLVHADVKPANAMVVAGKDGGERLVLLDFGLARLRSETKSAGGTPAYMAPEQLRDARVDPRSDVFSAGLVLVTLLTGWRRKAADQLVPPLDDVDPSLRPVLAKALALAPADRYQHGGELAAALGGASRAATSSPVASESPPFRHLAAFTESDRLYGRDREIGTLVEQVLFRRSVVYTAPSGTGKTSLLRAGLCPRLAALGVECVYVACHGREPPDLAREIWPEGETAAAAAALRIEAEGKRLVVVVDQVEAPLASAGFANALRELERATAKLELGVVFSVREDVLASLLAQLENQHNVLRLGPLTVDAAREAIVGPLIERRVMIEEPLLAALLADLQRAASLLAAEMRWSPQQAVYPPHLQLACSALFDQLAPGEEVLAPRHYEQLGGLDEIVRDYLDRVLETELPAEQVATARRVLLALVDEDRSRAVRTDAELAVLAGEGLGPVLEALRLRGIVMPLRARSGEPAWELVHDSLVPRVLAWSDRNDLARQRALEIVRHHLRGSTEQRPSLLNAAELRDVRPFAAAIDELDRDWAARGASGWRPIKLVAVSRRARRDRWIALLLGIATALGVAAFLGVRWFREREERLHEEVLSKGDLGIFDLELHAFDWNPSSLEPIDVPTSQLPLHWKLFEPSSIDELAAGPEEIPADRTETIDNGMRVWRVETRGGRAILQVDGRGANGETCAPSLVPLARLPGYTGRENPVRIIVRVPTCAATHAGTVAIAAGLYRSGGRGSPPLATGPWIDLKDIAPERDIYLDGFAMDRTEVTNAAYRMFAAPTNATAIVAPAYPVAKGFLADAKNNDHPVGGISWQQARAFCRFMGKALPSDHEWERALRGPLEIDGRPNPNPIRTLPWGTSDASFANLRDTGDEESQFTDGDVRTNKIDATPRDVSVEGILNLAGNVQEWTRTEVQADFYATRGCSWSICTRDTLINTLAVWNMRPASFKYFELGARCVIEGSHPNSD